MGYSEISILQGVNLITFTLTSFVKIKNKAAVEAYDTRWTISLLFPNSGFSGQICVRTAMMHGACNCLSQCQLSHEKLLHKLRCQNDRAPIQIPGE